MDGQVAGEANSDFPEMSYIWLALHGGCESLRMLVIMLKASSILANLTCVFRCVNHTYHHTFNIKDMPKNNTRYTYRYTHTYTHAHTCNITYVTLSS